MLARMHVDIADYIARGIIYSRKFLQLWTQREQFYKHFMVVIYNRSVVSCSDTLYMSHVI
jgi:hypothetical protein